MVVREDRLAAGACHAARTRKVAGVHAAETEDPAIQAAGSLRIAIP